MEINYQETTSDLLKRIDIHKIYGGRDIDVGCWTYLNPKNESMILDVGCGAGKQCFLYNQYTGGTANITGGDVNAELLLKARQRESENWQPCQLLSNWISINVSPWK